MQIISQWARIWNSLMVQSLFLHGSIANAFWYGKDENWRGKIKLEVQRSMPWKEQLFEMPCSSMTASQLARGSTEFVSQIRNLSTPAWQKVQGAGRSSAAEWLAVLTGWENYTHEWENTLESGTLKKNLKEKIGKRGFHTQSFNSIGSEPMFCSYCLLWI